MIQLFVCRESSTEDVLIPGDENALATPTTLIHDVWELTFTGESYDAALAIANALLRCDASVKSLKLVKENEKES